LLLGEKRPLVRPSGRFYALSIFIPAREFVVPFPCAFDDGIQRLKFWLPAKLAFDFFGRRDQARGVSWSSRFFLHWNSSAGNPAASFDHFAHARTTTCAEVIKCARWRRQCENMRIRQIADVNVVTNAGAIGRVVIDPENFDLFLLSQRHFQNIWD